MDDRINVSKIKLFQKEFQRVGAVTLKALIPKRFTC